MAEFEITVRQGSNINKYYLGDVSDEEAMEKAAWLLKSSMEYGKSCSVIIEVSFDDNP